MAPVAVEQDQEQDEAVAMQQAQMQQMQMQQQEQQQRVSLLAMFRNRKKIKELQKKIRFHRNRAEEHEDDYFVFLAVLAAIVDFIQIIGIIAGFFIFLFTFWVPLVYRALFFWGPRSYVWRGQTKSVLLSIGDVVVETNPLTEWLPANVADVCFRWVWSIEHKEADLILAHYYEQQMKMLMRKQKRAKL